MKSGIYCRMIDELESIDRYLLLAINHINSSFLDSFMWFLSGPWMLLILLPFSIFFLIKKYSSKQIIWILAAIVLTIVLTDQLSVHAFKEVFERYRPSHNLFLKDQLHLHQYIDGTFYRGGKYGFVSSHAANYFGILTLLLTLLDQMWVKILLLTIAIFVIYSRVYLGVHYLSDVLCGAILGWGLAQVVLHFLLLRKVQVS
jgi:undecaprenyl-diphosphatase